MAALIGDALPGLTGDELAHFAAARDTFNEVEGVTDGLGPVFNEKGCGNCQNVAAAGGSGVQFEVRAGRATSLQDAIARHDGQGALSAAVFSLLLPAQKADLLGFLKSL